MDMALAEGEGFRAGAAELREVADIERFAGRPLAVVAGFGAVVAAVRAAGPGARGVVSFRSAADPHDHMVNVAADDAGRVMFLDGQAGELAELPARPAMVRFVLTGGLGLPEGAGGLDPGQPAAGAALLAGAMGAANGVLAPVTSERAEQHAGDLPGEDAGSPESWTSTWRCGQTVPSAWVQDGTLARLTPESFRDWLAQTGRFTGQDLRLLAAAPADEAQRVVFEQELGQLARFAGTNIHWPRGEPELDDDGELVTPDRPEDEGWAVATFDERSNPLLGLVPGRRGRTARPRSSGDAVAITLPGGYVSVSYGAHTWLRRWLQSRVRISGVFDLALETAAARLARRLDRTPAELPTWAQASRRAADRLGLDEAARTSACWWRREPASRRRCSPSPAPGQLTSW